MRHSVLQSHQLPTWQGFQRMNTFKKTLRIWPIQHPYILKIFIFPTQENKPAVRPIINIFFHTKFHYDIFAFFNRLRL